jgi:uncharacterized protein YkwD
MHSAKRSWSWSWLLCLLSIGCAVSVEDRADDGVVSVNAAALTGTTLFADSFSTGSLNAWPARNSAWTTTSTLASSTSYALLPARSGAPVARVGTCWGTCSLQSPVLDLAGATAVSLELSLSSTLSSGLDYVGVRVYDGSTWRDLGAPWTSATGTTTWRRVALDLSAFAGARSFRFALYGRSLENGDSAQFDDVTLIAAFDSTPGGVDCRNPVTWPATWTQFEDEVLVLVNQRRAAGATCGTTPYPAVPAVAFNEKLREAARCHSLDMATQDYFSHTGLDGSNPGARIAATGYRASAWGENIAAGYRTPQEVVDGWMTSPGHCTNIMNRNYAHLGNGYAFDSASSYDHYWTQDFGSGG